MCGLLSGARAERRDCESTTSGRGAFLLLMVPDWGRRPEQGTTFFGEAPLRNHLFMGGKYISPFLGPTVFTKGPGAPYGSQTQLVLRTEAGDKPIR